jgi:hypothetical protein
MLAHAIRLRATRERRQGAIPRHHPPTEIGHGNEDVGLVHHLHEATYQTVAKLGPVALAVNSRIR